MLWDKALKSGAKAMTTLVINFLVAIAKRVSYSREHNRFPILPSFLFSPHGPSDKDSTISVLARCMDAV
jgi:hypothetical protein